MREKQEIFTMLGNKVKFRRGNYNPTCDAAWLAAFTDNDLDSVLDVGIGTGGVSLCLLAHSPNSKITGIDISQEMLDECAKNAALNGKKIELVQAGIFDWKTKRTFDAVITNPPYFRGTPALHGAHHNTDIYKWTRACLRRVRPRGYFYTIVDAPLLYKVIAACHDANAGGIKILPLFSVPDSSCSDSAKRVIVSARLWVRTGTTIYRGLPMTDERVLRLGLTIARIFSKVGKSC